MINCCPECQRGGLAARTNYLTYRRWKCRWCGWWAIKFYNQNQWVQSHLYAKR